MTQFYTGLLSSAKAIGVKIPKLKMVVQILKH